MSDWKSVLGAVAPGLATALGGPLAGGVVKILADKVLGGSSGDQVQDEAKLAGVLAGGLTPELQAKVLEAQNALKSEMIRAGLREKEIEAELEKVRIADAGSAREANVKTWTSADAPWYVKARQPVLAVLAVVGFMGCLGALMYLAANKVPVDGTVKDILIYALGCLTSIVMMVYSFDFGTSSGSHGKDQVLSHLLKNGR